MPLHFSNKSDPNKSFLQNYYDHLSFFYKSNRKTNVGELLIQNISSGIGHDHDGHGGGPSVYTAIPLKPMIPFTRLRIYRALHDAYDLVDEFLAATIVPPLLIMASSYLFLRAVLGIVSLGHIYHKPYNSVMSDLLNAALGLFLAAFSCFKASLSLIVRPLLTFREWNQSDVPRFCTGINDPADFVIYESEGESQEPYFFAKYFWDDELIPPKIFHSSHELERDWHLEVRPMLGFGN